MRVVVLHDNLEWFQPIKDELEALGMDVEEWTPDRVDIDMTKPPPSDAIFYNRCSASAHVRGHPGSVDQARIITKWLSVHDRVIINGYVAAELEGSKSLQIALATKYGIKVLKSITTTNPTPELVEREFGSNTPFVVKPDRGASGVDIRKFQTAAELSDITEPFKSTNHLLVVQKYVSNEGGVYRSEFVGGEYLYTSQTKKATCGVLNPVICPCQVIVRDFNHPILVRLENFVKVLKLDNIAFEFLFDDGDTEEPSVIDINTNTVYNTKVEREMGVPEGFKAVARVIYDKASLLESNG